MKRPRLHPPALHWPSIRGRARADAGPLLLAAAVVAAVALLAGAMPPLLRATADDAVQDTVRRAGDDADVLVHARWERDDGPGGGRLRAPHLAEDVDELRDRASSELGPDLRAVLQPPVAVVTSPVLNVTDGSVLRTFQLTYLAPDGGGPAVTWIAGTAPGSAVGTDRSVEAPYVGPPWPVQVGLSEVEAAALRLKPGDTIPLKDEQKQVKDVRVSGIFRPVDGTDPAWRLAPSVLQPVPGADGVGTTRLGGLLSRDSLPDARLAFDMDQLQRTIRFAPRPDALTWATASALAATVVGLKATSGASSLFDESLRWESRLDTVLRDAQTQIDAASAQASALLTGVLLATVLVLLVAADLLVHRRTATLTAARHRGAALPDLGAELFVESAAAALAATAIGLALARAVAPASPCCRRCHWSWPPPPPVRHSARSPPPGPPATGVPRRTAAPAAGPGAPRSAAPRWTSRSSAPRSAPSSRCASAASPDRRGRRCRPAHQRAGARCARRGAGAAAAAARRHPHRAAPGVALAPPLAVFGAARAAATAGRILRPWPW
ncbi:hypothetical protein OHA72_52370 [Dactylosporangium sp. NBC_01737]|uniref:hypothetical protein n=1 Tax=Dactylosporangium sp. NBC_01737 TaxID=2975959 RepID=UPI002E103430|nr:hypothetical protein OHA72_52370 [Dactylosporangium sp. NBC_01737]